MNYINNLILNAVYYLNNNIEFIVNKIIIFVGILLFALLVFLSFKLLNLAYLKVFRINKKRLDNLLSSYNNNLLYLIIKSNYVIAIFISYLCAFLFN